MAIGQSAPSGCPSRDDRWGGHRKPAETTHRPEPPAWARALRTKRTRQRCQVALSTLVTATFRLSWASEITGLTPYRPRRASLRRKAVQNGSAFQRPMSKQREMPIDRRDTSSRTNAVRSARSRAQRHASSTAARVAAFARSSRQHDRDHTRPADSGARRRVWRIDMQMRTSWATRPPGPGSHSQEKRHHFVP